MVSSRKKTSKRKKKRRGSKRRQSALRAECDRVDRERIRARLAMPVDMRLNFLRVRLPGGGSCL